MLFLSDLMHTYTHVLCEHTLLSHTHIRLNELTAVLVLWTSLPTQQQSAFMIAVTQPE